MVLWNVEEDGTLYVMSFFIFALYKKSDLLHFHVTVLVSFHNQFYKYIVIQNVPGGEVSILGGHSIGHSKKKVYMNMYPISKGFRYKACNIFLPSRRNAPLSEACESV
jgi:hypothetical protein